MFGLLHDGRNIEESQVAPIILATNPPASCGPKEEDQHDLMPVTGPYTTGDMVEHRLPKPKAGRGTC